MHQTKSSIFQQACGNMKKKYLESDNQNLRKRNGHKAGRNMERNGKK